MAERSYPASEARDGGQEGLPHILDRGGGQEKPPHVRGAVAALAQKGLEEPSHIEGQEGRQ